MDIKMPQLTSCCLCIPLRTGLLSLGYINLISHGLICILAVFIVFFITFMNLSWGGGLFHMVPLEWAFLFPFVMGSEVVFNILVVVAAHKKDARLLKLTLFIGTALWIFTVLYSICFTYRLGRLLRSTHSKDTSTDDDVKYGICMTMSGVILDPIILCYVLLLVRSLESMIRAEIPLLQHSDLERNREAKADYERVCQ